jgi:hypothetical protein
MKEIKRYRRIGETGWEVEWCSHIPLDENGDGLLDQAERHFRDFVEKSDAEAFAKEVYPLDAFGSVRITPFTIEPLADDIPHVATREYTADSEFYEGEA